VRWVSDVAVEGDGDDRTVRDEVSGSCYLEATTWENVKGFS